MSPEFVSRATSRPWRHRRWPAVAAVAVLVAAAVEFPASAASVENWATTTSLFRTTHGTTALVTDDSAGDGRALRLTLPAYPQAGPDGGAEVATTGTGYRYGTYGTRIKTADCAGQRTAGVVTGTFTYSTDHADTNGNGLPDNDEIDIEVLCAQPNVVWLTLWTDYRDSDGVVRKITRAVDLSTGDVLYNCYVVQLGADCVDQRDGENSPSHVTAIPGFDSSTQFHTYKFDWQADHVTFWAEDQILLWDYRGPASRIPAKPGMFLQNIWHTSDWDPLNGAAHDQPTAAVQAYVDTTMTP